MRLADGAADQVGPVAQAQSVVVQHARGTDVEEASVVLTPVVHGAVTRSAGIAFALTL